jgi:hypothetical protein
MSFTADAPTHLGETDVGGLLTEALTADVQAVLADETSLVGADTAAKPSVSCPSHTHIHAIIPILLDLPLAGSLSVCAWAAVPTVGGMLVAFARVSVDRSGYEHRFVRHLDGDAVVVICGKVSVA